MQISRTISEAVIPVFLSLGIFSGFPLVFAVAQSGDANPTAKPAGEPQLQLKLDQLREKHQLPALWAGKFHVDGRLLSACSGVKKWKSEAPAAVEDVIHIGSCTKAMTAVLVAQLCSQGVLSFDTRLGEIFSDVAGVTESTWGKVTIADLLEHRSGAPANASWGILQHEHPDDPVAARRAMLDWLVLRKRPEESSYVYSNVGYALLGHIVETLVGQPWERVLETRLFQPLSITTAGLGPVGKADHEKLETAWGHTDNSGITSVLSRWLGGESQPSYSPVQIDNPPPLGPAGRVHLSLHDWSKFVLLFADEDGCRQVNVKPEVWQQLLTVREAGNYAGGWILLEREWAGGRTLFHNGSNTTWYCVAFVAPQKGYCLLSATNVYSSAATKACDSAVAMIDGLSW